MPEKIETLTPELKDKIINRVLSILDVAHTISEKKKPHKTHDKLSFACPYCGDSSGSTHIDIRKKRGNIYWSTCYYHCYNDGCKKHKTIIEFLRDFNQPLESTELFSVAEFIRNNSQEYNKIDIFQFDLFKKLESLGVEKEKLFVSLNYYPIDEKTYRAYPYLRSRLMSNKLNHFAYNPKYRQLIILNLSSSGKNVLGYQIKNLETSGKYVKYLTYDVIKMRNLCKLQTDIEGFDEVMLRKLSVIFGITRVDLTRDFYVFEGPIDSFHVGNSIALSGINKESIDFDDIPTVKYFYDNDKAGKTKAIDKLKKGSRIFLWDKCFAHFGIRYANLKDLNDLMVYFYKNSKTLAEFKSKVNQINSFFSKEVKDIIYL